MRAHADAGAVVGARLHGAVGSHPRAYAVARAVDAVAAHTALVRAGAQVARVAHPAVVADALAAVAHSVVTAALGAGDTAAVLAAVAGMACACAVEAGAMAGAPSLAPGTLQAGPWPRPPRTLDDIARDAPPAGKALALAMHADPVPGAVGRADAYRAVFALVPRRAEAAALATDADVRAVVWADLLEEPNLSK